MSTNCSICCDTDNCQSFDIPPEEDWNFQLNPKHKDENLLFGGLEKELGVIFVIRKLLSLPQATCSALIRNGGSPSQWKLRYCSLCRKMIQEGYFVSRRIRQLSLDLEGLKKQLKGKVSPHITTTTGESPYIHHHHSEAEDVDVEDLGHLMGERIRCAVLSSSAKSQFPKPMTRAKRKRRINSSNGSSKGQHLTSFPSPPILESELTNDEFKESEEEFLEDVFDLPEEIEVFPFTIKNEIPDVEPSAVELEDGNDNDNDSNLNLSFDSTEEQGDENDKRDTDFSLNSVWRRKKRIRTRTSGPSRRNFREGQSQLGIQVHPCTQCTLTFKEKYILDAHVLRVHCGNSKPYHCDLCDKSFHRILRLLVHKLRAHGVIVDNAEKNKEVDTIPTNANTEQEFSEQDLMILNYIREDKETTNDDLQCKYENCTKICKSQMILNGHVNKKHLNAKLPFVCPVDICNKGYKKYCEVLEHCHLHVLQSRYFICSFNKCGKTFKNISERDGHQRKVHEGSHKPFICPKCSKSLKRHRTLQNHIAKAHRDDPDVNNSNMDSNFNVSILETNDAQDPIDPING